MVGAFFFLDLSILHVRKKMIAVILGEFNLEANLNSPNLLNKDRRIFFFIF
jgi:hypothetical protein